MKGNKSNKKNIKPRNKRSKKKFEHWLLLIPTLIVFVFFFIIPLIFLGVSSFRTFDSVDGIGDTWTLSNYTRFLTDPYYLGVLWTTIKIGILTTVICLIISYPVAYVISQLTGNTRNYLTLIMISPLLISMVIRAYGWRIILNNNGVINNFLMEIGLIDAPLKLLYTEFSVIVGMVHVLFPYMVLSIIGSLERIDPSVTRAANSLGANQFRTFFNVTLPLSLPGIFAGSILVFSLTTSSFVTPAILGGSQVKVMAYLTYEHVQVLLNWPFGGAIGFILIIIISITLLLYSRALTKLNKGVTIQ
ncbi:ABC transporter permease [Oceanobacillus zhaokaii]|uniref:ABC transporter permease n=1 Tax=Oceanobacillus zhaokaii TaxID=2052660 RepID=A0A345PMH2_9BACI|nr:ABC transporter permease [Oceanobacillus zhaokaii]